MRQGITAVKFLLKASSAVIASSLKQECYDVDETGSNVLVLAIGAHVMSSCIKLRSSEWFIGYCDTLHCISASPT